MSDVINNRELRYHHDPHHYSNWCKVCGIYFCWHDEAKEFDVHNHYQHDERSKGHIFEPREEALKDYDPFEEN